MTTDGSSRVMDRLRTLFPTLAGNVEHQAKIAREMLMLSEQNVMKAIDEYRTLGEKFLNPTQLMAIAYRIDRQEREREAAAAKALASKTAQAEADRRVYSLKEADAIIADMTDDEVLKEWAPILAGMRGKPREWAEKWPVEKVRTNVQLRLHVAGLAGAASA